MNEVLLMRKRNHEWDEGLINHGEGRKETARPIPGTILSSRYHLLLLLLLLVCQVIKTFHLTLHCFYAHMRCSKYCVSYYVLIMYFTI
jgi:hypothetical protein